MIELNRIYCEDCMETMRRMDDGFVDIVLTSPPYNTGIHGASNERSLKFREKRYDIYVDRGAEEYASWCVDLFREFDRILKKDGVILWNLSYGTNRRVEALQADTMINTVSRILTETNFTMADKIIWKKSSAIPNNVSPNSLTRICEDIFVFVRKGDIKSYKANKKIVAKRYTGQLSFENIYNFIEAKNSDGPCPYNKATFSSDLVCKLLRIYAYAPGIVVYDPFIGTGTTAIGCERMLKDLKWIGSEMSQQQCDWSNDRIRKFREQPRFQLFAEDERNTHIKNMPPPKKPGSGNEVQQEIMDTTKYDIEEVERNRMSGIELSILFDFCGLNEVESK